jgi:type I restriction enzyme S subunit
MTKKYPTYKSTNIEWLSKIPGHWETCRARFLYKQLGIPPKEDDGIVTAFRDGQVTLRELRRADGYTFAIKELGYQGVRQGHLVIHSMDAFAGAIGVSDSDGKCTGEYVVCEPRKPGLNSDYYAECLRIMARRNYIYVICPSVRERAPRFRYNRFKNVLLPVPPAQEQKEIFAFINRETSRIDSLIEKKERQIKLLKEKRSALIHDAVQDQSTRNMRIGHVVDRIFRPIARRDDRVYIPVGLYNRGRGIFHKEPTIGADLGDSNFFWIKADDLILSGQFAWEGAVALASKEEAGCVASHRYPIIRGKPNLMETAYLYAFLTTKAGIFLLNEHSRGAAGRNRPLNANTLLKETIPVPPIEAQARVSAHVYFERMIDRLMARSLKIIEEYRTALITAATTGKIDVRKEAA